MIQKNYADPAGQLVSVTVYAVGEEPDFTEQPAPPVDPRKVGDITYSGYWRTPSVILDIQRDASGYMTSITELNLCEPNQSWSAGTVNVKTHCTQWDWQRDQFIDHNVFSLLPSWGYTSYDDFIAEMRDIAVHWINPRTGRNHA